MKLHLRIIAFDPGVAHLGYGLLEVSPMRLRVLAHGDVGEASVKDERVERRLDRLASTIDGLFNTWLPDVCGYENQSGVEVAMQAAGLSNYDSRRVHEVTGMIRCSARTALAEPLPVFVPSPRTIKVATLGKGCGGADKAQVRRGIKRLLGVTCGEHAADALACSIATLRQFRLAERAQLMRTG